MANSPPVVLKNCTISVLKLTLFVLVRTTSLNTQQSFFHYPVAFKISCI